jgi:hypothetical protein
VWCIDECSSDERRVTAIIRPDLGRIATSMLAVNEGKACDAVVRRLERRENGLRQDVHYPEQENHAAPVEMTFTIGEQLFAMEHTAVEPFKGHMQMEAQAEFLFKPIVDDLKDQLGSKALFELVIPANALQNKKGPELSAIQKAIVDWVKATASTMPARDDSRGTSVDGVSIPNVPFSVSLFRYEPPPIRDCYFQIKHAVAGGEQSRSDRMFEAIKKKFPKLAAWRRDQNAKTILVLEDNDIQLTNPSLVADTFVPLAKERGDRPDETYLVVTCMDPWHVWPVLIGDKSYFDLVKSGDAQFEGVDPAGLVQLTKR